MTAKGRNEFDWSEVPYPTTIAGSSSSQIVEDVDHSGHLFLYVPDLGSETGWASHRLPERKERVERRTGFHR